MGGKEGWGGRLCKEGRGPDELIISRWKSRHDSHIEWAYEIKCCLGWLDTSG